MTSTATSGSQPIDIRPLLHPRERLLFCVNLGLAAAVLSLVVAFVPDLLLYLAAFAVLSFLVTAYSLAQIRGNGVRVSERQFPAIHSVAVELEARLGLAKRPAIYVLQSNGVLNAFAAKFVRRDIVVLNSDLLELVADRAGDEIAFVLAHELAHVKRRHVLWRLLLAPAAVEPFKWQAYSRACEFTCDRIAATMCPSGAPGDCSSSPPASGCTGRWIRPSTRGSWRPSAGSGCGWSRSSPRIRGCRGASPRWPPRAHSRSSAPSGEGSGRL